MAGRIFIMVTLAIVVITVLITIAAFNSDELYNRLILWPRKMTSPAEYYRLLTSGFIHADWNHIIFNMIAFYSFGGLVERMLSPGLFVLLYLTGIVVASLPSFLKNRNNSNFRSLGASGGVAAIIFFSIYYGPWNMIGVFFIPMPSILFAVAYLIYSAVMSRSGRGIVNHDAHLWGSVYGLVFAFIIDPTHGQSFVEAVLNRH